MQITYEKPELLPSIWRMFILHSYYCTDNLGDWSTHLRMLNSQLDVINTQKSSRNTSSVLLLGSPVYFPNYKVPFLIHDVKLDIAAHLDYTTEKFFRPYFVFVGGDFCDICPNKIFSPALGGWWVNLALGGFLTIPLIVGSFYVKRFWCQMCPMGFLLGMFHKFNLFKLKKDCTACTERGACYESCPMRLKSIYIEREKKDIQTIDCLMCGECIHKCQEDHALSMTFCGKTVYKSSRSTFMSRHALESHEKCRKNKQE